MVFHLKGESLGSTVPQPPTPTLLDDIYRFQFLSFHPLRGNREGQFAAKLTGRWRLIVEPGEDERTLSVVEVEDYHG